MRHLPTVIQLLGFLLLIASGFVASPFWGLATAGFSALIIGFLLDREAS